MKRIGSAALACCALIFLSDAKAASLSDDEIERAMFLSMLLNQNANTSRLGARIIGQEYPNDDSMCDYVAERLLKGADPTNRIEADSVARYATTLRESCSARYRNALTIARQRYTDERILRHIDDALAIPVTVSVEQYAEDGVDLLTREAALQQQLKSLSRSSGSARGFAPGTTFGQVARTVGVPQELSALTVPTSAFVAVDGVVSAMKARALKYGRSGLLVAHYKGTGLLIFHRRSPGQWELLDTQYELFSVDSTYEGTKFGIAQSLACLRGEPFRVYLKTHAREIRQDRDLLWVLTNRLNRTPFPINEAEEDGLVVAVKVIVNSRHAESPDMLRQIGAAPGEVVPKVAREYLEKLERRGMVPQAANE